MPDGHDEWGAVDITPLLRRIYELANCDPPKVRSSAKSCGDCQYHGTHRNNVGAWCELHKERFTRYSAIACKEFVKRRKPKDAK